MSLALRKLWVRFCFVFARSYGQPAEGYYRDLGLAYGNRGYPDLAIRYFNKAIILNPKQALYYYYRALQKQKMKDCLGAISDYTKSISFNFGYTDACISGFSDAYIQRAISLMELMDYQGAVSDCTNAIALDRSDGLSYGIRGIAKFNLHDYEGALQDFTASINLAPNHAMVYSNRADVKVILNDFNGAENDFSKAIELDPFHTHSLEMRAELQRRSP